MEQATKLPRLVAILFRPRATMRAILDAPRDRWVVPLVVAAFCSTALRDFNAGNVREVMEKVTPSIGAFIVAVSFGVLAASIGVFYLFAAVAMFAGRTLEGTGKYRELSSALAWGLTPIVYALLYRLPIAIIMMRGGGSFLLSVAAAFLDVVVLTWVAVAMSNTIGEAHRFSTGRGFGTFVLTALAPVVIIVAAILSFA